MICPNCRRETPDGMAFCFNCGAKLAAPSQVQQAQQQAQAAQQQAQQQAQAAQRQAQEQARLAAEKAQREAAERAQREAAEKAQREAAEKAQREAAEAQARAQREAQARAQREAQAAQQQAQQAQQQAQQAAQNPYPYGPQFNQQPQQYGPQGPQQYGPKGPQQYGPQGPQQYGPQGPQQYGPQGPQQFAPQPPKQPSAFEKLLSGEPNWLVNFYTKYYNFFLIICSLITIAFVGNAFAFRGMTGMTLSNLFLAGAAAGAAVFAQIMLTNKKFLGWIMTFVAAGLRFATVIVVMIGLFVIVDEYSGYGVIYDTTPLTLYNCFYSIVALMVQGALAAFAVILFLKNKDQYK